MNAIRITLARTILCLAPAAFAACGRWSPSADGSVDSARDAIRDGADEAFDDGSPPLADDGAPDLTVSEAAVDSIANDATIDAMIDAPVGDAVDTTTGDVTDAAPVSCTSFVLAPDGSGVPDACWGCSRMSPLHGCDHDGVPISGRPNYPERAIATFMSAFRMDTAGYIARYITPRVLDGSDVNIVADPVLPVLRWEDRIAQPSHDHSVDAVACPTPVGHSSCSGATASTRVQPYADLGSVWSEMIFDLRLFVVAPLDVVNGWICDGSLYPDGTLANCPASGSLDDRSLLLTASYVRVGTGFASAGGRAFATAVVEQRDGAPYDSPIVLASHQLIDGVPKFFVDYAESDATAAPRNVGVVLDGRWIPATREFGSDVAGVYTVSAPSAATACRSYYVLAITGTGRVWRYPATGVLRTHDEGGCAEDYVP